MRRLARRPLERGQLLDLVDDAQPVRGVDEQVGGILDDAGWSSGLAQLVDEEGRHLDGRASGVHLPADDADPAARRDPFRTEELGQWRRRVTRLIRQAQILEAHGANGQWSGFGGAIALVAGEERRLPRRSDDQHRLLEAGVEAGQVGEVGAVLAVGPDDQAVVTATLHPFTETLQPIGVDRRGQERFPRRHAEVRQLDIDQPGPTRGRDRHRLLLRLPGSWLRVSPFDRRELARTERHPGSGLAVGPRDPDLGGVRIAETDVHPAELPTRMATADGHLASPRVLADPCLHPRANGIDVRSRLPQPDRDPPAHRLRLAGLAAANVAPQLDRLNAVDHDEVEQPIEVEVDQRATARPLVAEDPGSFGSLDKRAVSLADQQVARITGGVPLLGLDVALGDEQVAEPVVVHVGELGMPCRSKAARHLRRTGGAR